MDWCCSSHDCLTRCSCVRRAHVDATLGRMLPNFLGCTDAERYVILQPGMFVKSIRANTHYYPGPALKKSEIVIFDLSRFPTTINLLRSDIAMIISVYPVEDGEIALIMGREGIGWLDTQRIQFIACSRTNSTFITQMA